MDETQRAIEEGIRRGIESADRGPELIDWLMAVGDAGAFLATLALVVLAMQRMRHTREQADVAESRPRLRRPGSLMREASAEDATRRVIDQKNERANEQRVARRRQADTRARHARLGDAQRGGGAASAGRVRPRAWRAG
jgi:hypothetical protein